MGPTLLSLPAEIRLMIWDLALPDKDEPRVVHHPPPFRFCYQRAADPWALYRTCRLIRNELPTIDAKGITLVLHLFPWQNPSDLFSGPKPNGPESLWSKFQRLAPYVERLRISGPKLCMPGTHAQHATQLRRVIKQAPMPALRAVEVQPQGWSSHDWALAFSLVSSFGLGRQDVAFLTRDGRVRKAPTDLHLIPEWTRLKHKTLQKAAPPMALREIAA